MLPTILSSLLILTSFQASSVEWSLGARYSSYHLYWNDEAATNQWGPSVEVAVHNFVPRIGFKIAVSTVKYEDIPFSGFDYTVDYVPLTLVTSFDILPFFETDRFRLFLETGIGVYFWEGESHELSEDTGLPCLRHDQARGGALRHVDLLLRSRRADAATSAGRLRRALSAAGKLLGRPDYRVTSVEAVSG